MRVRCFTQDDAHIFMTPEQIRDEIKGVARLINEVYSLFGFRYHVELSTRPEDSMGSDEDWELATSALKGALDDLGLDYVINEGDGRVLWPQDRLPSGRFHRPDLGQCGTIQLDFSCLSGLNWNYIGADGEKHRTHHDPPGSLRLHRAVHRHPDRAFRGRVPHLAGSGAG